MKLQNHDDDELDHELYDPWDNLDPDDEDWRWHTVINMGKGKCRDAAIDVTMNLYRLEYSLIKTRLQN